MEVCEPFELSLGVMSVVDPGIGALDGVDMVQGEGEEVSGGEVRGVFPSFLSVTHC